MSTSRRRFLKSAVAVGGVTLGQRLEALPGSPPGAGGPAARAAGSAAPVQERRLPTMDPGTGIGPEGYGALDENSVHYVAIRVKPENFETAVKRVSDALGLEFEYLGGETSGIRMALAMEARIEIVTTVSDNVDTTATDAAAYPAVMAARDHGHQGRRRLLERLRRQGYRCSSGQGRRGGSSYRSPLRGRSESASGLKIQRVQGSDVGGDVRDELLPQAD